MDRCVPVYPNQITNPVRKAAPHPDKLLNILIWPYEVRAPFLLSPYAGSRSAVARIGGTVDLTVCR